MGGRAERKIPGWAVAALTVFTAAVFWPVLLNGFVPWDDPAYLVANPNVRGLSAQNLREIFGSFLNGNYHPLPLFSYSVEHHFFGLDPRGYHAVSLAWHVVNALLALWLFARLGIGCGAALLAAAFFAVHPMRVEAVAWVAARKDLMCAGFSLLALHAHLSWRATRRRVWLAAVFGAFLLALLSKGTAMALPAVLLAVEAAGGRRIDGEALREKLPHAALALVFAVIAVFARQAFQGVLEERLADPLEMAATAVFRFSVYFLGRTVLPVDAGIPPYARGGAAVVLAGAGAALAVWAATRYRKRFPGETAGLVFFAAGIFPALPVMVLGFTADRFAYFPSVGLALAAGFAADRLRARFAGRRRAAVALVALAACLLLGFAGRTSLLARDWKDAVALSTRIIRIYEGVRGEEMILSMAYVNRAMARAAAGDAPGALVDFDRAVEAAPPDFPIPGMQRSRFLENSQRRPQ